MKKFRTLIGNFLLAAERNPSVKAFESHFSPALEELRITTRKKYFRQGDEAIFQIDFILFTIALGRSKNIALII